MRRLARALQMTLLLSVLSISSPVQSDDVPKRRMVALQWRQAGEVAGFNVYVRYFGQPVGPPIDIGLPKPVDGIYTHYLEVSNMDASFIRMTSYSSERVESDRSNEVTYLLD